METIENVIDNIANEDTVNIAAEAVEAIPAKSIDWAKVGKCCGVVGAIAATGAGIYALYKHVANKKQEKDEQVQPADTGVDNVKIAEHDFVEQESTEE